MYKGQFWAIFRPYLRPLLSSKSLNKNKTQLLWEKNMLFRGNLRKMPQQIGVNLEKIAILG